MRRSVAGGPPPRRIAAGQLAVQPDGPAIPGIAELVRTAAAKDAPFSELGAGWAVPTQTLEVVDAQTGPA